LIDTAKKEYKGFMINIEEFLLYWRERESWHFVMAISVIFTGHIMYSNLQWYRNFSVSTA